MWTLALVRSLKCHLFGNYYFASAVTIQDMDAIDWKSLNSAQWESRFKTFQFFEHTLGLQYLIIRSELIKSNQCISACTSETETSFVLFGWFVGSDCVVGAPEIGAEAPSDGNSWQS